MFTEIFLVKLNFVACVVLCFLCTKFIRSSRSNVLADVCVCGGGAALISWGQALTRLGTN